MQAELLLALAEQHLWLSADSRPLAASPAQPRGLHQQKGGEGWKWGFMRGVNSVTSALEFIGAVLLDLCFQMGVGLVGGKREDTAQLQVRMLG